MPVSGTALFLLACRHAVPPYVTGALPKGGDFPNEEDQEEKTKGDGCNRSACRRWRTEMASGGSEIV